MNVVKRLVVIAFKLVKLGMLLVLVRSLGTECTEHIRASFSLVLQRSNALSQSFSKKYS